MKDLSKRVGKLEQVVEQHRPRPSETDDERAIRLLNERWERARCERESQRPVSGDNDYQFLLSWLRNLPPLEPLLQLLDARIAARAGQG